MKKTFLFLSFIACLFAFSPAAVFAQKQIEQKDVRDPVLEADAMHNLEVARQAFRLRKAYKGVLMRCEEIIAANPAFSKLDEVLYLSGMSSYYLSINKGKQKVNPNFQQEKEKYAPEKLRDDAIIYFKQLIDLYPQSGFRAEAEKTLKLLEAKK
ncbi:MAG TPA: outer membrane protein assembly factor BamD [Pyrinomonadaceae bacterium]|nr:outer membrane protein assembly factor BamD [Pyrinomonadaceae bacterium]